MCKGIYPQKMALYDTVSSSILGSWNSHRIWIAGDSWITYNNRSWSSIMGTFMIDYGKPQYVSSITSYNRQPTGIFETASLGVLWLACYSVVVCTWQTLADFSSTCVVGPCGKERMDGITIRACSTIPFLGTHPSTTRPPSLSGPTLLRHGQHRKRPWSVAPKQLGNGCVSKWKSNALTWAG